MLSGSLHGVGAVDWLVLAHVVAENRICREAGCFNSLHCLSCSATVPEEST